MATTRELMNKVLRGLRQEPIATSTDELTDSYELLILQFLNEAKEELEEEWDWYALRNTVTVTLSNGTSDYDLTTSGSVASVSTNDRTRLLYEKGRTVGPSVESSARTSSSFAQAWDITDSTEYRLTEVSVEYIERLHISDSDET